MTDTIMARPLSLNKVEGHKVDPETELMDIVTADEPGPGGANHHYMVYWPAPQEGGVRAMNLHFQKGPIQEAGVNGVTNEALLAIVAHRLQCFQNGQFACKANEIALDAVRNALHAMHARTRDRRARGVEGKSEA